MPLPSLPEVREIQKRLNLVFPEGTPHRVYVVREMAAKTIFAMLYVGAIEGSGSWLAPKHVYRLSSAQARMQIEEARQTFRQAAMRSGFKPKGKRWYADNSREPVRDETLREGLIALGAVTIRAGVATTSPLPRYALKADFAELFNPQLQGDLLDERIAEWQKKHLSAEAQARLRIVRHGRTAAAGAVAAVIWISESGNKVVERDDALARDLALEIHPDRALPDIILADTADPLLLVFVEVVATDGSVNESRRQALLQVAHDTGIDERHLLFLTAFLDRGDAAFRKAVSNLAWGSFAWFAAEPSNIVALDGTRPQGISKLRDLLPR